MRNVIILGSGRSGTSMVAGVLAQAGFFMGDRLIAPRESNPKGFFEDAEVNAVNEDLLASVAPGRPRLIGRWLFRSRPRRAQRWLAALPVGTTISCTPAMRDRIAGLVARRPFCFKDPRFCYTLPVWRPLLEDTLFLCVFRDPGVTAASILTECRTMPYLRDLRIDFRRALDVWTKMYQHVLRIHRQEGDWIFVHYDQVFSGAGIAKIEADLDIKLDHNFPDARLRRSTTMHGIPEEAQRVYAQLCDLAAFRAS